MEASVLEASEILGASGSFRVEILGEEASIFFEASGRFVFWIDD